MGNNNIDALYRMVASAVQNKTQQEERTLLSALQNIDHYGEMAAARLSKKRLHTDFGVEYEMPENWKRLKNRHPDSVMFYADCDMEEEQEHIPAAFRIVRKRGDYRGYENLDKLERLAVAASKAPESYEFKYIRDVRVHGRKGVKAVCIDHHSEGQDYDAEIYLFYKSKTEVMMFFCISSATARPYYIRVFREILRSIRYTN